jgi:hypothetical protein
MTTVEICKLLGLSGTKAERIERINAHAGDPQPPSEDRCTAIIATPVQLLGDVSHAVVNARGTLVNVAKNEHIQAMEFHGSKFIGNDQWLEIANDHAGKTDEYDGLDGRGSNLMLE